MRTPVPGLAIEQQPEDVLLAMLAWGEARGETFEGKVAVCHVAMNRALKWGRTLRRVILQPWQFSCFNEADPNRVKLLEPLKHDRAEVWGECWDAANGVLARLAPDPTHGATHYTTAGLWGADISSNGRPRWYSRQAIEQGITRETARIGSHVFGVTA